MRSNLSAHPVRLTAPLRTALFGLALARHPGRFVEAELDGDEHEVEILSVDGVCVELEYYARTGRLREVGYDD